MPALRLTLIGTVILAMLGGLSIRVVAHSEETSVMEPAMVAGEVTLECVVSEGTNEDLDRDVYGMEGVVHAYRWASSDARLSGDAVGVADWVGWFPPEFVAVSAMSWEFTNDQGGWMGSGTGIGTFAGMNIDTVTLQGEGAYEGLTAYLLFDWDVHPVRFGGVVFPGTMPGVAGPPHSDPAGPDRPRSEHRPSPWPC